MVNLWVTVDGDALDAAVHADQLRKSLDWDLGCSGDELNQLGEVLLTILLHQFPEPNDDLIRCRIALIICISLPIFHIYKWQSRKERRSSNSWGSKQEMTFLGIILLKPYKNFLICAEKESLIFAKQYFQMYSAQRYVYLSYLISSRIFACLLALVTFQSFFRNGRSCS